MDRYVIIVLVWGGILLSASTGTTYMQQNPSFTFRICPQIISGLVSSPLPQMGIYRWHLWTLCNDYWLFIFL